MELDKVIIIKKKTAMEELLVRHSTKTQAEFYLKTAGHSSDAYQSAENVYQQGLSDTTHLVPKNVRSQVVDREHLSTYQFSKKDLVVVVGDPGLFINAAKYVGEQPVIVVNPDRERFDDVLSTCDVSGLPGILENALAGRMNTEALTMAEAVLNDGQRITALNDLFIGRRTHVSARYTIEHQDKTERQSTSGVVVSTGTGSTGWLMSFKTWTESITEHDSEYPFPVPFGRDEDHLIFNVREPFPSKVTGTEIVRGMVTGRYPLIIQSNMPEDGVIFSDGVERDYLEFTSGRTATIKPSDTRVYLVRK